MDEAESQPEQRLESGSPASREIDEQPSRHGTSSRVVEPFSGYVDGFHYNVRARRDTWYGQIFRNYWNDDADGMATFIAFNAMFAFMPVVLTLAIGLAVLLNQVSSTDEIENGDFAVVLPEAISDPVQKIMDQSSHGLVGAGAVTLVVLFWGGSRLYHSLDRAFARIYRRPRRPWVARKVVGLFFVPAVALIVVITALIIPLLLVMLLIPLGRLTDAAPGITGVITLGIFLFGIAFIMMIAAYTAIPTHAPTVRSAIPGASVAAFLFVLLAFIFPLYRRFFGDFSLYGAVFGLILTMMFWFYLAAQIIIIGAEINAYREGRRAPRSTGRGDSAAKVLRP